MKISLNWLKEHVNTEHPVDEIAAILTDIGLEVEGLYMMMRKDLKLKNRRSEERFLRECYVLRMKLA